MGENGYESILGLDRIMWQTDNENTNLVVVKEEEDAETYLVFTDSGSNAQPGGCLCQTGAVTYANTSPGTSTGPGTGALTESHPGRRP